MNANTFRSLEFETVRALLLAHAGSARGEARLLELSPSTDSVQVGEALAQTSEGGRLLRGLGRQPYHDLPDVDEILISARVEGFRLEPGALMDVASFIEGGVEISRRVAQAEGVPRLAGPASEIRDTSAVAAAIRKAILPGGEIADDASPKLAETRRAMARLRTRLHSVMESFLRGKDSARLLQEKLITTRNDRCVLLVKSEQRSQLPGIIHGSSGSGASLFVEPMPAVELNNDIVALGEDERREVARILGELTSRVGAVADDLAQAADTLGELDAVQAKALFAADLNATAPEIVDDLRLDLRQARHPLLLAGKEETGRARHETVPVDLQVGSGTPVLVISGPNTGGKTVALKTAGLLALMAQSGLHIPVAAGSRLPVFKRIYADIGDEQSIAADLSTFSAHLASIVEMTQDLAKPALVLLDEVGAGTDPTEGGGLGVAIVDHFRERGAMVVATTHHGLMKAYGQSTPGVSCASFGYDPDSYEPTYELSFGTPGRSLALEMAERLGLPAEVVTDARSRLDEKQAQAEALLGQLELQRAAVAADAERVAQEQKELAGERERLARAEMEIEVRKRRELETFARDLRKQSDQAARKTDEAIRKAVLRLEAARKPTGAAPRARTEARTQIGRAEREALAGASLDLGPESPEPPQQIEAGSRVRVRDLGFVGEVLGFRDGQVIVTAGGKRLQVPRGLLTPVEGGGGGAPSVRAVVTRAGGSDFAPGEINLVGLTVDEALPRVDKLLDDAALSERRELRLIHGFGQGRLRSAVAGLLDGHPHVAAFRLGRTGEGGGGVTVVELKD